MSDMTPTIVPKSDQLNSDDLISGPITIKITKVAIKTGEQPISISFEGDNGKPYKCCKSMARVMVSAWGADSKAYVGRSMTLYRDPTVKWAGMEVGGIRISHLSDIDESMTMALTVTRSNRKAFTVRPLVPGAKTNAPAPIPAVKSPSSPAAEREAGATKYIDDKQEGELLDLMNAGGVALKAFLAFGEIDSLRQLEARHFENAKKWIAKNKVSK